VLDAERVVFGRLVLTWDQWTAVWEPVPEGELPPRFGPKDFALSLLPPTVRPPEPSAPPPGGDGKPASPEPSADGHDRVPQPPTHRNGPPAQPGANGSAGGGV